MPLPVYDLTGLKSTLKQDDQNSDIFCSARASTLQSMSHNKDSTVYQVRLNGKNPFIVSAIITEGRTETGANHIRQNLVETVTKTFKSGPNHTVCPLYSAILRLNNSFKELSAYGDSVFPHSSLSVCLIDIRTHQLHALSYGSGSILPHITSSDGSIPTPQSAKNHFLDGVLLTTASYALDTNRHSVVLGSSGLWTLTHPAKAAIFARLFSTSEQALSTVSFSHDPATEVIRSALRSVIARCAPSSDARLASLYNIKQLDRLPPGTKSEATKTGIIPRRRGDIHQDLTAIVLSLHVYAHPNKNSPTLRKSRSWFSLQCPRQIVRNHKSFSAVGTDVARDLQSSQHISAGALQNNQLALDRMGTILRGAEEMMSGWERAPLPSSQSSSARNSPRFMRKVAALQPTRSSNSSTIKAATTQSSDAVRRWQLIRLHVLGVVPAEATLKRACWESALSALSRSIQIQATEPSGNNSFATTSLGAVSSVVSMTSSSEGTLEPNSVFVAPDTLLVAAKAAVH